MTDLEVRALEHWQIMAALQVKFIEASAEHKAEVARSANLSRLCHRR